MAKLIYHFEDVPPGDLPRPPLAALRALRIAGVALSHAGWLATPVSARRDLMVAGARDEVIVPEVHRILQAAPIREIKLVPRIEDPPSDVVPPALGGATGPARPLTPEFWRSISGLDRHVLVMLGNNARLLYRALAEIALRTRQGDAVLPTRAWTGTLAHAEVRMAPELLHHLGRKEVFDGRGLILARVAGIRAARWASEILDLHAHAATGPVEVGYSTDPARPDTVIWQAHVSTTDGEFSPSASMLAVVTASAALQDIAARAGGIAVIESARLAEEPWFHAESDEEVTIGM